MMQFLLADILPAVPEMVMATGAMLLLILGVLQKKNASLMLTQLAMVLIVVTAILLLHAPHGAETAFSGMFVSNRFIIFAKILILISGLLVLPLAQGALPSAGTKFFEYPILILFAMIGMMLMVSANNFLSFYIGLELQSLSIYVLAACNRDNEKSSEAGLKYFILGSLTSGILLYGISLIYGFSGTIEFNALHGFFVGEVNPTSMPIGLLVGLILVITASAFKISAVPFHMWTPDVYEGAPTPVTAFMSTAPKIAASVILVRLMLEPFASWQGQWQQVIIVLSAASMVIGALGALRQRNIKRLMAYSSIGHVGFVLMGLASASDSGVQAILIYLGIYISMSIGVFSIIMMMQRHGEARESTSDLSGFAKTHPLAAIAMTIFMLSMAGIPPFAGFFGKYYVLLAALDAKLYTLAVIGVLSSVISTYYYINIIRLMYFDELGEPLEKLHSEAIRGVLMLTAVFNLFYVIYPTRLIHGAIAAAQTLFL